MHYIQLQQTSKQTEKTMREIEIFFKQRNSQNEVATAACPSHTYKKYLYAKLFREITENISKTRSLGKPSPEKKRNL